MKYRVGFVSNSSSCSFQIYGICSSSLEDILLPEMVDAIKNELLKGGTEDEYQDYEFTDLFETYLEKSKLDLEFTTGQDAEYKYIGSAFPKDDETPVQWRARIKADLAKIVKPEHCKDLSWHEESWYDG